MAELNANDLVVFGGMVFVPMQDVDAVRDSNLFRGLKIEKLIQSDQLPGYIGYFQPVVPPASPKKAKPAPAPAPEAA